MLLRHSGEDLYFLSMNTTLPLIGQGGNYNINRTPLHLSQSEEFIDENMSQYTHPCVQVFRKDQVKFKKQFLKEL